MDGETFFYVLTGLALIYAVTIRFAQRKLMDQNLMKEVQEQSKKLNEAYKEAAKNNDKRRMDEVMKMNEQLMPKMNQMMIGQMKMMAVVLIIFFAFTWVAGQLDPYPKDDFSINLTKTGDEYVGSFALENATSGFWYVTVKAYNGENEVAQNQTIFFIGEKTEQIEWIQTTGSHMDVFTSKETYSDGEQVTVSAKAPENANRAVATFSNGTRFYVDLPVTIPLINLRRIYDSQSWFIFSAVILGLFVNPAISFVEKNMLKKNKEETKRETEET